MVDPADIARRLHLGEDSRWEFKQIGFRGDRPVEPRSRDLADELAAFANASGGMMLCGVTDAGEVQGLTRAQLDGLERMLVEISTDTIKPAIQIATYRLEIDGKALLAVEVESGYALHDSPGGSYRRVGSSKRVMTSDERLRLSQRRAQSRFLWFDKQPVPDTGFNTLDESIWKPLLSAEGRADPETALEKLALLTEDDRGVTRATVAGVLLCSAAPHEWLPNACITATLYAGSDRASGQLDAQTIVGPLPRQVADAMAFAVRNMRVGAYKDPARMDLPQYSVEALFEALVNAVAHRDYSMRGSRIRLSMFADRLEIDSPGGLPNNLTIDAMEARQSTRNEAIASVLGRVPVGDIPGSGQRRYFMERRGDGVPVIFRETRALCGRSPSYRLLGDSNLFLDIPAATTVASPATVAVTVHHEGGPVAGADVLVLFPNKTYKQGVTNDHGEASVELYATDQPMTVFVAAQGLRARVERDWVPAEGGLAVDLQPIRRGGAVIFPEATGPIPGLRGRLNPIRDSLDRSYLYASNIAINQGEAQPVHFRFGEEMRLTDSEGAELAVRVMDIVGRSALLEYRVLDS